MSMNRVLILAIAGSFVAFGHFETTTANDLTAEHFLGKWNSLAMITNATDFHPIECSRMTVKKTENDQTVDIESTGEVKGQPFNGVTKAEFHDSGVRIISQASDPVINVEFIANVNNGQELIFREKGSSIIYYELLSRQTTASAEIMKIMEDNATSEGLKVIPLRQTDC